MSAYLQEILGISGIMLVEAFGKTSPPSSDGSTTITALVARFADPQAGRILVDGHDLRTVTLASWTARLGMVFQDTLPVSREHRRQPALRPAGRERRRSGRRHRLSGGEKQRVAIARVILRDPRVLILDEATSNLDSVSEQHIQAALRPLLHGRTSIVIAHRLSTILAADKILVFDEGRLIDTGTHHELLGRGGLYTTLYERQFRTQPAVDAERPLAPVSLG
jgi:ATP-binding cassette subfamily B protein